MRVIGIGIDTTHERPFAFREEDKIMQVDCKSDAAAINKAYEMMAKPGAAYCTHMIVLDIGGTTHPRVIAVIDFERS